MAGVEPEVDVVVVSWNVRDDLLRCLTAVDKSAGVKLNVFVVDNASEDQSADAVEERFPRVSVVRNETNDGFARAANQGVALGAAPYVLLLNPDADVGPGSIRALTERLDQLPRAAAVAPQLIDEEGHVQHSVHPFPSIRISLMLATGVDHMLSQPRRARLLLEGSWRSDVDRDVPWAIGAALLARRSVFDEIGLLDERFFVYVEDLEWCDRAARAGYSIRFTPSAVVTHVGNRSGSQRYGADRIAAYLRNTIVFCRLRRGRAWTAIYVLVNAIAVLSRFAWSRVALTVRPTPARRQRLETWRAYARYYLGRARPPV